MNGIRSVGVTAFDIFGILLPGAILVIALRIMLIPTLGPIGASISPMGYAGLIGVGLASYLAGHLVQLIGRFLERLVSIFLPWGEVFRLSVDQAGQQETALALRRIRESLAQRTGLAVEGLSDVVLSNLSDEYLEQFGNASTLANYRSREVYYRGISAAMLVLAVALGICSALNVDVIAHPLLTKVPYFSTVTSALSLVIAVSAGDAYRRQRRRRMRHSLIGYLVLETGGRLGERKAGDQDR